MRCTSDYCPNINDSRKVDTHFIGVEVNSGRDRSSKYQTKFFNKLYGCGGLSFITYSFGRFYSLFERRGLPLATDAVLVPAPIGHTHHS